MTWAKKAVVFASFTALAVLMWCGHAYVKAKHAEAAVACLRGEACLRRAEKVANICKDPFIQRMMGAK